MTPKLELISFKLCPFVQRAVIVLKQKNVDFDITYIDLNNPPEWFEAISPLGQVPVLKVGDEVLFESAVIQEYVDEITPPSLQPEDPLIKAKNRAWISFGNDILFAMHAMITSKDGEVMAEKQKMIEHKLAQLEAVHSGGNFFNGEAFNMIDAAYAPMFMRIDFIKNLSGLDLLEHTPKLTKWSDSLLKLDFVKQSVVEEVPQMYCGMIKNMDGVFASRLCD
ncbi:glutathione S-transferase family protein [Thiomicrorhabdus sp. ZW0627]|uniref:glutathione S-transferase family protein n=1 Tax=Thiomicrorhabdus sp. ZW0627 TaxID=3039774 RepID=UPI0024367864|nr:glutathione S-transferase family protein [Thiomicrorhabdus sp. ZW0627]MDG6773034.1 glutathione S-transferase family protein [Thiomicrorhabdus sp. ZW0627]